MWACFEKYSATRKRDILVFGWLEQRWVCFFLPFKISNYQRNSYQNDQLYVHRYCTSFPYSLEGTLMSRVISSEDQAVYQACWTWSSRGGISFPKGKKTTIKCGRWGGEGKWMRKNDTSAVVLPCPAFTLWMMSGKRKGSETRLPAALHPHPKCPLCSDPIYFTSEALPGAHLCYHRTRPQKGFWQEPA